jgi:hypothetical protein
MITLADLLKDEEQDRAANSANAATSGERSSSFSKVSSSSQLRVERLDAEREERRSAVVVMMAAAPNSQRRFWHVDDKSNSEYVIVTFGIRDVGTCELSILRERYDPFRLLEIINSQLEQKTAGEC